MEKICANAEFIVVFKSASDEVKNYYTQKSKLDLEKIAKNVQKPGNLLDAQDIPIFFTLDRFKAREFYRDVHTFDKEQFEQWAIQKCLASPAEA